MMVVPSVEVALAKEYALTPSIKTFCRNTSIEFPPIGWHVSEKMDGMRAVWLHTEKKMVSRTGHPILLPPTWEQRLPTNLDLDGELIACNGLRESTGLFRKKTADALEWKATGARFFVFDVHDPDQKQGVFETRFKRYVRAIAALTSKAKHSLAPPNWVVPMNHIVCRGVDDMDAYYSEVVSRGGEGVVLRAPQSMYATGRTPSLLKHKHNDQDAFKVLKLVQGRGKLVGKIGSLEVERLRDGSICRVSAVTDQDVKPGDHVLVKFFGVSRNGVPLNASFIRRILK
jgi:DNA ligase 1